MISFADNTVILVSNKTDLYGYVNYTLKIVKNCFCLNDDSNSINK